MLHELPRSLGSLSVVPLSVASLLMHDASRDPEVASSSHNVPRPNMVLLPGKSGDYRYTCNLQVVNVGCVCVCERGEGGVLPRVDRIAFAQWYTCIHESTLSFLRIL